MRLDLDNGPLTDPDAEAGEREARAHLFAGVLGGVKNPHSHRSVKSTIQRRPPLSSCSRTIAARSSRSGSQRSC
ncbi:TIGR02391 family protein [Phenylobacterium sp.]|uniref:TIGR02391 family protein n=1 Tax=Phenylobacterium sp. TaxID=1871053 RepID=UPI0037839289